MVVDVDLVMCNSTPPSNTAGFQPLTPLRVSRITLRKVLVIAATADAISVDLLAKVRSSTTVLARESPLSPYIRAHFMMLTCDSSVRGANVVAMTSQSGGNPTSECDNSGEHPIL